MMSPYVLKLIPARSLLMVVDVQERLAAAMPEGGAPTAQKIDLLLEGAQLLDVEVLVTEQYPKGLGATVPLIRERLGTFARPVPVVEKLEFDATQNPQVAEALDAQRRIGKTHVLLTGMEAHICVYQTVRGLLDRGFCVHVVGDAIESRTRENAMLGRELARSAGGIVTGAETVLFDWLGKAGGDAFKAISKRLR